MRVGRCWLFVFVLSWVAPAQAELVRFEITERVAFAGGHSFGAVGPYEKLVGRAYFALDPTLRQNEAVVDLELAPRNAAGRVEFWADLCILAPADPTKGNGALLYDVNNRGNKLALGMFNYGGHNNPTTKEHAGDGFLMRHGFTVIWSGWDGELLPGGDRLRLFAPQARDGETPITGTVRCEFIGSKGMTRSVVNWANHGSYRPTAQTLEDAPHPHPLPTTEAAVPRPGRGNKAMTLTLRERPAAARVVIPRDQWTLHVTDVSSDSSTQLPNVEVEMPGGMQPGFIYELIYEASNPLVMGVGFTSVRDLIAALKHGTGEGNPLTSPLPSGGRKSPGSAGTSKQSDVNQSTGGLTPPRSESNDNSSGVSPLYRAHGFGVSQSGRFLREFLYSGFNEDELGRPAFDGLIPHVAGGGLGSFNHRFAQPTRHSNQHDHHDYPPDRFPFAYETQLDPLSGREDGLLKKSLATKTAPFVMHTQSTAEYWTRSGSLPHTDPLGTRDAKPPAGVRFYTFGGTQHGPSGFPPSPGNGQNLPNPADYKPFLRSLLLALDKWANDGTEPPDSVVPRILDHTLVDWRHAGTGFPNIPGVAYPETIQQPSLLDFGPRWETERIIDLQPPRLRGDYRVLAPRCGADGNELGCLLPVEVAVPVATHTGWNPRKADVGAEGQLVSLTGSYIPFPVTKADRERTGDPRPSVQERYGSLDEYTRQLTAAADKLKASGYLLDEDADRLVKLHRERVAKLFEPTSSR